MRTIRSHDTGTKLGADVTRGDLLPQGIVTETYRYGDEITLTIFDSGTIVAAKADEAVTVLAQVDAEVLASLEEALA